MVTNNQGHLWLAFAFAALLGLGFQNFLSGTIGQKATNKGHAGLSNFQVQDFCAGTAGTVFLLWLLATGRAFTGRADRFYYAVQVASGCALALGNIALCYGIATNYLYKAFISAVLPVNAVIMAGLCWIVLSEPVTKCQAISILIALAGLALMAASEGNTDGLAGLGFGMITAFAYAIGNFGLKIGAARGVDSLTGLALLWLGFGLVGIVSSAIISVQHGAFLDGLGEVAGTNGPVDSTQLVIFSVCSGCLMVFAVACLKTALSMGPPAPAMAIANANAGVVLALDAIFFHPEINAMKAIGLGVVIVGVGGLALAPQAPAKERLVS